VLSAVEGLKVATPALEPYVLPLTLALLIALFPVQRRGAGRVGGMRFNPMDTSFFVRREKIVAKRRSGIALPFKKLLILLSNMALDATEFFGIPVNRIVELGGQIEL